MTSFLVDISLTWQLKDCKSSSDTERKLSYVCMEYNFAYVSNVLVVLTIARITPNADVKCSLCVHDKVRDVNVIITLRHDVGETARHGGSATG